MTQTIWPGDPHPLGATWDGSGTNFALFAENATAVLLCLFDEQGHETQIKLPEVSNYVWHGYLPGIGPGQRYGFRVEGVYEPELGKRFNAHKLLLDPYAKAIAGDVQHGSAIFGYLIGEITQEDRDLDYSELDDVDIIPKCTEKNERIQNSLESLFQQADILRRQAGRFPFLETKRLATTTQN
ncbi:MAG: hypothetical protein F6K42_33230, partial [Leptolyngbya sp. SIO1D8]|nr:hypothetical protein [Leptolyngbya sp. SIO1D8]